LFYNDSITDSWTKKDWVLNLLPLGGIASVAYEIGSACLSVRDRTTKISQDFFKSPIRTTIKKIAQCLWVPIVICGALKLVYLIVFACWDRCFPPVNNRLGKEGQLFDPTAEDPCEILPPEIVDHIFSYLNLRELGISRSINKRWNTLANTPLLWKAAIYREIAFSSKNWAQWNEEIVKGVDFSKEHFSLPENIVEELRRSYKAFPGKSIKETHVLVRMPKGLTIKKLGELAKKYFPSNAEGYIYIWSAIVDELGDKPADEPVWMLMTKNVLSGSRCKSYIKQKNIVAEFAKTARVPYEVPTILEAATCILAEYSRSGKRLFSDRPWIYTRCQDNVQGYQMIVGGFAPAGLRVHISPYYDRNHIGVAALRKF
jgi:hypothetical protein